MSWQYLAGFVDGEGCIRVYRSEQRRGIACVFRLGQCEANAWVLFEIQKFLSGHGVEVAVKKYDKAGKSPEYRMTIQNQKDFRFVLEKLQPYFIVKAQDCEEALTKLTSWQASKGRPGAVGRCNSHLTRRETDVVF